MASFMSSSSFASEDIITGSDFAWTGWGWIVFWFFCSVVFCVGDVETSLTSFLVSLVIVVDFFSLVVGVVFLSSDVTSFFFCKV